MHTLNTNVTRNESRMIDNAYCFFCCRYSDRNFVEVIPKPKVAKVAEYIIVVFTTPYSPYKSLPKKRAIKIPANSRNALPSPLPTTAQKESRARALSVIFRRCTVYKASAISCRQNHAPIPNATKKVTNNDTNMRRGATGR